MVNGNKKTENPVKPCPRTLAPRLPDVCEKNVFRLIRSSASGKQHLRLISTVAEIYARTGVNLTGFMYVNKIRNNV